MFYCGILRNAAEFSRVWDIEQQEFADLSIPAPVAREMFRQRPEMFLAIFCAKSTVAAYSAAYPLKPRWAQALIAGEITEPDLTPDMLLGRHEPHDGASIYVGTVLIAEHYDALTRTSLLAALVSWRARQMREGSVRRMSVMMTAVSKQGEKMIRYVRAKQLNSAENRKDGYAIYGRTITPRFLNHATIAIERCLNGRSVEMSLDMLPTVGSGSYAPSQDVGYAFVGTT